MNGEQTVQKLTVFSMMLLVALGVVSVAIFEFNSFNSPSTYTGTTYVAVGTGNSNGFAGNSTVTNLQSSTNSSLLTSSPPALNYQSSNFGYRHRYERDD
jgi:hypothetical protein